MISLTLSREKPYNKLIFNTIVCGTFFVLGLMAVCFGDGAANPLVNTPSYATARPESRMVQNEVLERMKAVGGEVVVDGSLRTLETSFTKNLDLVEISSSVTPMANHVRLFAVAVGTYTLIKAQFDDGQIKTLINN